LNPASLLLTFLLESYSVLSKIHNLNKHNLCSQLLKLHLLHNQHKLPHLYINQLRSFHRFQIKHPLPNQVDFNNQCTNTISGLAKT
jgi:hypothetical protein